jgi:hypothetical protein
MTSCFFLCYIFYFIFNFMGFVSCFMFIVYSHLWLLVSSPLFFLFLSFYICNPLRYEKMLTLFFSLIMKMNFFPHL